MIRKIEMTAEFLSLRESEEIALWINSLSEGISLTVTCDEPSPTIIIPHSHIPILIMFLNEVKK